VTERDRSLKGVAVSGVVRHCGIWAGDLEEVAEFGEEEGIIGALSGTGAVPALDEGLCGHEQ
jgi:hypothetical protein